MPQTAYWNRTAETINRRKAIREGILSDTISKLQDMYPHLNFGKTVTVNDRTYYVTIIEQD